MSEQYRPVAYCMSIGSRKMWPLGSGVASGHAVTASHPILPDSFSCSSRLALFLRCNTPIPCWLFPRTRAACSNLGSSLWHNGTRHNRHQLDLHPPTSERVTCTPSLSLS